MKLSLELMTGGTVVVLITRKTQNKIGKRYFLLKDSPFSLTRLEGFFLLLSPHLSHGTSFFNKSSSNNV